MSSESISLASSVAETVWPACFATFAVNFQSTTWLSETGYITAWQGRELLRHDGVGQVRISARLKWLHQGVCVSKRVREMYSAQLHWLAPRPPNISRWPPCSNSTHVFMLHTRVEPRADRTCFFPLGNACYRQGKDGLLGATTTAF